MPSSAVTLNRRLGHIDAPLFKRVHNLGVQTDAGAVGLVPPPGGCVLEGLSHHLLDPVVAPLGHNLDRHPRHHLAVDKPA